MIFVALVALALAGLTFRGARRTSNRQRALALWGWCYVLLALVFVGGAGADHGPADWFARGIGAMCALLGLAYFRLRSRAAKAANEGR